MLGLSFLVGFLLSIVGSSSVLISEELAYAKLKIQVEQGFGALDGTIELGDAADYTKLYLYTRETGLNYTEIVYGDLSTIQSSAFNSSKTTKILIHGWLDNAFINAEQELTDAYLEYQDVNIICVDWRKTADNLLYPVSRYAVVPVGKYLARVVDWLVAEAGVSVGNIHILGHSLGAHIGGVVGEHISEGQIGRISGLDPAGPLFGTSKSGRLDSSDALFVDVIHTCGGLLGYFDPCGHVDFYPNKGTYNQPGCSLDFGKCSHIRSYKLFAESIGSTGFVSTLCDSWSDYNKGLCQGEATTVMGEYVDLSSRGTFYLKTAGDSPYALGKDIDW